MLPWIESLMSFDDFQLCVLLLSAGVIRNHHFVENAMQLRESLQYEVMEMIEEVVSPESQPNGIKLDFGEILTKPCSK